MWSKIGNVFLSIVVIFGGVYFYMSSQEDEKKVHANENNIKQLTENNQSLKEEVQQLEIDLEKAKQEATGLHRNIESYLSGFDDLIKESSSVLPTLKYTNEEEHQALLYAKTFLQQNSYKGELIVSPNEIVTNLEANPTDQPSVYAIFITTYRPQYSNRNQLPDPTSIRFGSFMNIQVAKDNNGWNVTGEINKIY